MCQRTAGGIRYGRMLKPMPELNQSSVDVVEMNEVMGPHHAHPKGEIDVAMPIDADAEFDGHKAGWLVYSPNTAHRPTVRRGRARVVPTTARCHRLNGSRRLGVQSRLWEHDLSVLLKNLVAGLWVAGTGTGVALIDPSMDILLQAWTRPGPTIYDGQFDQYKYLNPFRTPYQKPYPKIYVVGSGIEDKIQYAAEKGFGYSQVFTPVAQQLKCFENYRRISTQHGHEHDYESIIISAMVYVEEGRSHILFYFLKLLRTTSGRCSTVIECVAGAVLSGRTSST
jgi:hypothetical protein